MQSKLTPKVQAEIRRLHSIGYRQIDIAIELEVSTSSIYSVLYPEKKRPRLKDYGLDRRVKVTDRLAKEMSALYSGGMTYQQIADKYEVALSTVYQHIRPGGPACVSEQRTKAYHYKKSKNLLQKKSSEKTHDQYLYRKEIYRKIKEGELKKCED